SQPNRDGAVGQVLGRSLRDRAGEQIGYRKGQWRQNTGCDTRKSASAARCLAVCQLWKFQQGGERRFKRAAPPLFNYELGRWPINAVILLCPRDLPGPERRLFDRYAQGELFACRCEGLRRPPSQAAPRFPLLLQASR